jgi:hypothetical protein
VCDKGNASGAKVLWYVKLKVRYWDEVGVANDELGKYSRSVYDGRINLGPEVVNRPNRDPTIFTRVRSGYVDSGFRCL